MSEQAKTPGRVAHQAFNDAFWADPFEPQWMKWDWCDVRCKAAYEAAAQAVIAHHEAAQWRPMSEQDEGITDALVFFESVGQRWVQPCEIHWKHDDKFRFVDMHNDELLFDSLDGVTALAWRHLPDAPEVPR